MEEQEGSVPLQADSGASLPQDADQIVCIFLSFRLSFNDAPNVRFSLNFIKDFIIDYLLMRRVSVNCYEPIDVLPSYC
jgi:hypothetical protein